MKKVFVLSSAIIFISIILFSSCSLFQPTEAMVKELKEKTPVGSMGLCKDHGIIGIYWPNSQMIDDTVTITIMKSNNHDCYKQYQENVYLGDQFIEINPRYLVLDSGQYVIGVSYIIGRFHQKTQSFNVNIN